MAKTAGNAQMIHKGKMDDNRFKKCTHLTEKIGRGRRRRKF